LAIPMIFQDMCAQVFTVAVSALSIMSLILLPASVSSLPAANGLPPDPEGGSVAEVNSPPSIEVPDYPIVPTWYDYTFKCNCTESDLTDHLRLTWLWGDGRLSVTEHESNGGLFVASASHEYHVSGIYTLTVWIDDLSGALDHNVSDYGYVGAVPVSTEPPSFVSFYADTCVQVVGHTMIITALATDQDSDILTYTLDFGNGDHAYANLTQGTPWVVEYQYPIWGYYELWASVTDGRHEPIWRLIEAEVHPVTYCVNLSSGWNMFSLPVIGWGYTSNTLGLTFGDVVVPWDSGGQIHDSGFIVGLSPPDWAFPIEEGVGYWIYSAVARSLTLYGANLTETHSYQWIVPDGGGWVLVGFPQTGSTLWGSDVPGLCDTTESVTMVCGYNTTTHSYNSYIVQFPLTDFQLSLGQGYWVYLTESVTVEYGP